MLRPCNPTLTYKHATKSAPYKSTFSFTFSPSVSLYLSLKKMVERTHYLRQKYKTLDDIYISQAFTNKITNKSFGGKAGCFRQPAIEI